MNEEMVHKAFKAC
jgi:hypothetical protein